MSAMKFGCGLFVLTSFFLTLCIVYNYVLVRDTRRDSVPNTTNVSDSNETAVSMKSTRLLRLSEVAHNLKLAKLFNSKLDAKAKGRVQPKIIERIRPWKGSTDKSDNASNCRRVKRHTEPHLSYMQCFIVPPVDVDEKGVLIQKIHVAEEVVRKMQQHNEDIKSKFLSKVYSPVIILDCGANLGAVSLPFLMMHYRVYAVEPLIVNLQKLELASHLNKVRSNLTMFHGALGIEGKGSLLVQHFSRDLTGPSMVVEKEGNMTEKVPQLNFWSIISAMADEMQSEIGKKTIVFGIKMDVEGSACRAVLAPGGERVLQNERIFIPYIFIEWIKHPRFVKMCPIKMELKAISLLTKHGYQPYTYDGNAIKVDWSKGIQHMNYVWEYNSTVRRTRDLVLEKTF